MSKFEINATYTGRFIGDSDCLVDMTVIKRTAKTVVVSMVDSDEVVKRLRIKIYDGVEYVEPFGHYSMCLRIKAA